MQNKKIILNSIFYALTTALAVILLIFAYTSYAKIPVNSFRAQLYDELNDTSMFIAYLSPSSGVNIYIAYYILFLLMMAIAYLSVYTVKPLGRHIPKKEIPLTAAFFLFCFATTLQTNRHLQTFRTDFWSFNKKPLSKKYGLFLNYTQNFIEFCRKNIPLSSKAQLITDLNINNDPGMQVHRILRYFLYPIDVSNLRKGPIDYLIFFEKRDAKNFVPAGYTITATLNSANLIAQRK